MGACNSTNQPVSPSRKRGSISGASGANAFADRNGLPPEQSSPRDEYFKQIINSRSPLVRLDHNDEMRKIKIKGDSFTYHLHYCYVSQRGYYPDALGKANQDSYVVCEAVLGEKSCNMFGIFDGHGEYGDLCSHFAADSISVNVAKEIRKAGGVAATGAAKIKDVYTSAFADANFALHNSTYIDDSLSGTTAITVVQKGDKLLVANVGDSRAIIASMEGGKLVYSPLSSDQTPYRKDERERLKKAGAKIMTIDQIEGNEPMHENFGTALGDEIDEGGDPPRVWDSTLEQPGCAFSRSVGDAVAKRVGVSAVPEILEWSLTPDDRFAVIASDGVFEFITSQGVVDMIAQFEDPLEAAKHVVAEAYRLWLTYDDRTDDISIILLMFRDMKSTKGAAGGKSPRGGDGDSSGTGDTLAAGQRSGSVKRAMSMSQSLTVEQLHGHGKDSRPVRKVMSRRKRMDISEHWDDQEAVNFDFDAIESNKTDEEIARISQMLSTNFMFANLNPIQKDHIFKVMTLRSVKAKEPIIKEGDRGDEMYIVDSGHFLVSKVDENGTDQVVFTYTKEGSAFGELSLMYGKPRAASVTAKTDGQLWCIGRAAFRAVIMRDKQDGLLEVFQTIPVFKDLSVPALHRLCLATTEAYFEKGEVVVDANTTGNQTWAFAVIVTGILRFLPMEEDKKRQLRAELTYFSLDELGSKFSEVRADCKTKLVCIPKDVFAGVLGKQGMKSMKETVLRPKAKGKRLNASKSMFLDAENLVLPRIVSRNRFSFDHAVTVLGDFAYVGTFKDNESQGHICSIKVIAKGKSHARRMDAKLLQERNFLAAIYNVGSERLSDAQRVWLPTLQATFSDETMSYMVYKDVFVCDLGMALHNHALADETHKVFYMAAICSAVQVVHAYGLLHRFINMNSVLITAMGIPKLCDFRYAKRLDGSRSFTICGDPLFFAPEIVSSKGYDYAADLWAVGVLLFELYEQTTPFGHPDTEETVIFKALTSFDSSASSLKFTQNSPPPAQELVKRLLQLVPHKRAGYLESSSITGAPYFADIDWDSLPTHPGHPVDIRGAVDVSQQFDANTLPAYSSPLFDQF